MFTQASQMLFSLKSKVHDNKDMHLSNSLKTVNIFSDANNSKANASELCLGARDPQNFDTLETRLDIYLCKLASSHKNMFMLYIRNISFLHSGIQYTTFYLMIIKFSRSSAANCLQQLTGIRNIKPNWPP